MRIVNRVYQGAAVLLFALGCGLATAATANAAPTIDDVSYRMLPGGAVEVSLIFNGPAIGPTGAFTTTDPPRIALDFANTANTVAENNIEIGAGATSGVTVASAGGRTRVVIDLFRPSSYDTEIRGNRLLVEVDNGIASAADTMAHPANDPTKVSRAPRTEVTGIDFRRGQNGAGRVIVGFSSTGVNANMHREGDRVVVDLHKVNLPENLANHLDVIDFATPVQFIEARRTPTGAKLQIAAVGDFEVSAYQTGTEYVVEVAPPAKEDKKADVKLGPDGRPLPVYTGERVTFNFQDIPVRQVLHLIADLSHQNVVVSDTVGGQITLRLINVPWDQALDIVLRAKGLDKRKSGNVIWIAPQAEIAAREQALAEARMQQEISAELVSAYIPISYGKAADIAKLLTEGSMGGGGGAGGGAGQTRGFLSPRGSVSFDQRTNTLLVNDTPEQIAEIRKLVSILDKPVEQVLIESRIVVANDNFTRELGVRFGVSGGYEDSDGNLITTSGSLFQADRMANIGLINRYTNNGNLPASVPGTVGDGIAVPSLDDRLNVNLPVVDAAGGIGLAILGADYLLDLELSAAQVEGKGEIISSPRVITANQQAATIKQGQQIGYVTFQSSGGGGGTQANVQFKDAVLELTVTPTITADRRVFLDLNVKKDSLAALVPSPGGGFVPQIDTREVSTSVLVDNGETVVLGGIYEITKREDVTKVPLLGDIPWLGALFRNTATNSDRAELLIFVTPRILNQNL